MDEDSHRRPKPPALNRISLDASWVVRRIAAGIVGIWLGGIVLVSVAAPAAFSAADAVARNPPAAQASVWKKADRGALLDLLRYHAGEANGRMFETWGTLQTVYGLALLLLLLFFSVVGRLHLGLAAGMLAMALFMKFYLIPAIAETGRIARAADAGGTGLGQRFRYLHLGFSAFELAAGLLGLALLVLLLRQRRKGGGHALPDGV